MNSRPEKVGQGSRSTPAGKILLADQPNFRILVVDDESPQRKMMSVILEQSGIAWKAASSALEALDILQKEPMEGVIADLNMPGMSGMELLKEIRLRYPRLVFLMATGVEDVRLGVQAMRQGADDYLIKPLQVDSVLISLDRAFERKSMEQELESYRKNLEAIVCERTVQLQRALGQLEHAYGETLDALGAAIDLRDGQTAGHSRRTAVYSMKILSLLNGTSRQYRTVLIGAWLHDIGKLAIPDSILLKPSSLTAEERKVMQTHVQIGHNLVKRIQFLSAAAEIILHHHERWDGSGFPQGLKGPEIPFTARVFAIADALDAMTSERPYHLPMSLHEALQIIQHQAGTQFDPEIVKTLLAIPKETLEAVPGQSLSMHITAALAGISMDDQLNSPDQSRIHAERTNETI